MVATIVKDGPEFVVSLEVNPQAIEPVLGEQITVGPLTKIISNL